MAPPRKSRGSLCKSAKYYRDNPKARKKKATTDKKVNSRSGQKAKRRELSKKNYDHDKKNGAGSRKGKDYDHAVGRYVSSKTNRGRSGEGNRKKKSRKA